MLLLHVRFAREDAAKRGTALAVPDLADTLRRLGYAVKIRTALGGGSGGACLRSLRHSFLTVSVAGPTGAATYVVDPRFRDQVPRLGCGFHSLAACFICPSAAPSVCTPALGVLLHCINAWLPLAAVASPPAMLQPPQALACPCMPTHLPRPPAPLPSPPAPLQFEIAHTTPRYSRILAAVGPEFVGSQDRLNKVC